ncbi:MAG TPA: AAA family ATPase [Candidatus Dormibacteraeota bacterium]|nr:AAA family ATPase [Candidatus Dormibacteraeota bacterium]
MGAPGDGSVVQAQGVVALLFAERVDVAAHGLPSADGDAAHAAHLALMRAGIEGACGREVQASPDGFLAVFASPVQSVSCATELLEAVACHNRDHPALPLATRIGLHIGMDAGAPGAAAGPATVVRQLCATAGPGQILASKLLAGVVGSRRGFTFVPSGQLALGHPLAPVATVLVEGKHSGREPPAPQADAPRSRTGHAIVRGPRLVGRDRELDLLEAELAAATAGEMRTVLLVGEPGVGKTRLARELLARNGGKVVALSARAYPFGETSAFGLWAEALDGCLRRLPAREVTELCRDVLDDLAPLLRSVAAVRGERPGREAPRTRLLEGLAVLLSGLADREPVLLLLDDMHLADASSWDALHYLAHRVGHAPILVVMAARPAELAEHDAAGPVLLGLEQEGLLRRIAVSALDVRGVAELAGGELRDEPPEGLVEWLARRSQGNPLFALGLLRALVEEGADLAAPELRRVPEGLAERVSVRLDVLDAGARGVLELLAVVGQRVELDDFAALDGWGMDELATHLDRLVRGRLVEEVETGRELTYEVAHPLIQESVYQSIGGVRRRGVHRQVARALLAGGRLDAAAPHFACSADVGDAEAIEALSMALRQAGERQANREALGILASLVEVMPTGDARWLKVADAMSAQADWVYRGGAHAELGIRAMREMDLALQSSPEPARRAMVKFLMANFLTYGTGELPAAERACGQALELFEKAGDRRSTLLARLEIATLRGFRGYLACWEDGARQVADAAGEDFVAIQALGDVGHVAAHRGRFAVAEGAYRRNLDIARSYGRPHLLTMSLTALATCLSWEGRLQEALPLLAEARAVNPAWRETLFHEWATMVHWLAGDFPAVIAAADDVVARSSGPMSRRRGHAMHLGALAALEAGDIGRAERYARRAREAYGEVDWFFYTEYCTYVEAMLAWRKGTGEGTVSTLRRVARRLGDMEVLPQTAWVLVNLVEIAAASGSEVAVTEASTQLEQVARRIHRELYRGLASMGLAWSELVSGNAEAAAATARAALGLLSSTGCRAFVGQAQALLGRALADIDTAASRAAFAEAVATFDACGAVWRRDRARAALRGLGSGVVELPGQPVRGYREMRPV